MAKRRTGLCPLCGGGPIRLGRDHLPPKAFFPDDSRPRNYITIFACDTCNHGRELDDEWVRNWIALQVWEGDEGRKVSEKVKRAFSYQPSVLDDHKRRVVPVSVESLGLGNTRLPGITAERERIERWFKEIVRGLHFHHFGASPARDAVDLELTVLGPLEIGAQPAEALKGLRGIPGDYRKPRVTSSFYYSYVRDESDPLASAWVFVFLQQVLAIAVVYPTGVPPVVPIDRSGKA